jgi:hypothetical protein
VWVDHEHRSRQGEVKATVRTRLAAHLVFSRPIVPRGSKTSRTKRPQLLAHRPQVRDHRREPFLETAAQRPAQDDELEA